MMRRRLPLLTGLVAFLAIILLIAGGRAALHDLIHAQSSPSISIGLSPSHSVPMDTAITGAITLSNLDVDSYSSVIFRADITPYRNGERRCNGDDTGRDIEITVAEPREVFTVSVFDACPNSYYSYGSYTLDVSISKVDTDAPGGMVELASARTYFSMSRYMTIGVPTATPPEPGAQAWMDPDPRTLDMYANGEWHLFRFRSNVQLYLNDHLGVQAYGSELDHFVAPGEATPGEASPGITVEEACKDPNLTYVNWRRAINQSLWIAACKPGEAIIRLIHETDGVDPLYVYNFRTLVNTVLEIPEITITVGTSPVTEGVDVEFTITRSGDTTETLTVNVSVTETGSMLSGSLPSTMTFEAGDDTATLTVQTDDDSVVEDASEVTAELRADTNSPPEYTVGAADAATVTVNDNDAAAFTVSVNPSEVAEGGASTVAVSAGGVTFAEDQTIDLTITGSADVGDDFTIADANGQTLSAPYRLTLPAGVGSVTATVNVVNDTEQEPAETIAVEAGHDGSVIDTVTITVSANDATSPPQTLPTVSYRSAAYTVREGSSVTITVTLSPAADRTVTVPITVTADSAESGDYTVAGLTGNALTFDVGDSSKSFTISAHEDPDTDSETVDLGFDTLSDASVGAQSTATVTITDNDSANDDGGGSSGGSSSSSGGGGGGGASRKTVTPPVIVFSPESLSFTAVEGGDNPPSQTLEVWNDEKGEMDFRVTDSALWLYRDPSSGTSDGPRDVIEITVSVDVSGLEADSYSATIRLTGSDIENSPRRVPVTLTVVSPGYARERVSPNEETVIETPDSAVRIVVPEGAASEDVDIEVERLDAESLTEPPGEHERVVLSVDLNTLVPGGDTPRPMTYSPGVELQLLLSDEEEAACDAGRVRVYLVDSGGRSLLEHRCEADETGRVWAVTILTRFSAFMMAIDDAPPTPTPTMTAVPTATPVPTAIPTAAPTATPVPTPTPTAVSTATLIPTPTPTAVPTTTPIPTPTKTAAPTDTPVPTAFPTTITTATPIPTPTPTAVPTTTPVPTATPTAVPTATPVPTAIPTVVPTAMPTAAPTAAPTATSIPTATPTSTPTPVPALVILTDTVTPAPGPFPQPEPDAWIVFGPITRAVAGILLLIAIAAFAVAFLAYRRRSGAGAGGAMTGLGV